MRAILDTAEEKRCDLIMIVTHGRGGVERQDAVKLGSVADAVLQKASCPVFLVSAGAEVHRASERPDAEVERS